MRPVVNPALRRLWRGTESLQLGLDPDHALVLEGIGPRQSRFLALLDGTRDGDGVLREARTHGMSEAEVRRLLELLATRGFSSMPARQHAAGAAAPVRPRPRWPPTSPPGRCCLRAQPWCPAGATQGEQRPRRRRTRRRARRGAPLRRWGRAGAALAGSTPASVERPAAPCRPGRAHAGRPGRAHGPHGAAAGLGDTPPGGQLLRERRWHVGPLVVPGAGPCLGCLDLHRGDRDPGWPLVAAQLATRPPAGSPAPGSVACDLALATAASALGALAALAVLDGPVARPARAGVAAGTSVDDHPLLGAQWLLRLPFCLPRRRTWGVHPACGCGWPGHVASREPA